MNKEYAFPYVFILFSIALCTIIFSTYFIAFFLAGVVFKIFAVSLRKGYNYILMLSIVIFLIIENTQGLKPFMLTGIAMLIYFLIIPRIKHLFSSEGILSILYMLFFYLLFYFAVQMQSSFSIELVVVFLINFIIDILIVGFIL